MPAEHLLYGRAKTLPGGLCMYVCMYVCVYVCVRVCVQTHTRTDDICSVMFTVQLHYKLLPNWTHWSPTPHTLFPLPIQKSTSSHMTVMYMGN
jgi:hypothetical protein